MARFKIYTLTLVLLAASNLAVGQVNRYMVFFADKDSSAFSIDRPEEFLSARAMLRRVRNGVATTAEDFPVNRAYSNSLKSLGIATYFESRWMNGVLVQMDASRVDEVAGLDFVDGVEFVAPGGRLTVGKAPAPEANPFNPVDTADFSTDFQLGMLGIPQMHADGFFGQDVLIAVMDGGFSGTHTSVVFQELYENDQIVFTRDLVSDGYNAYQYSTHGTSVLSCMAGGQGPSLKGGAPQSNYALFVTEEVRTEYRVEEYNWLFAAEMADSMGVDIINTSLGYTDFDDPSMNYATSDMNGETAVISRASEIAASKGILLVTSAGNLGNSSSWQIISAPADASSVLSIGAVDHKLNKAGLSSVGPTADNRRKPDLVALGENATVFSDDRFRLGSGTSFAAPLVTGLAAGLLSANPQWTTAEVISHLRASGTHVLKPNNQVGNGIPNYEIRKTDLVLSSVAERSQIHIYPNPLPSGMQLNIDLGEDAFYTAVLVNVRGQVLARFDLDQDSKKIDLMRFGSGRYFIKLLSQHSSSIHSIIKE